MAVKIDLTGREFGNLEVIRLAVDIPGKKKKWLCRCKNCGREVIVQGSNLQSGHSTQCKACQIKDTHKSNTKHGQTRTKLYYVWNSMINRCENPNTKSYCDYGEKGISVCEEWHDSKNFFDWALSHGYKDGLEIDRIDTSGNYCPENCRWITRLKNANNKTNSCIILHNGEKKTLAEWARYYGVNYKQLHKNISKGYSFDEAVKMTKAVAEEAKSENEPEEGLFGEE